MIVIKVIHMAETYYISVLDTHTFTYTLALTALSDDHSLVCFSTFWVAFQFFVCSVHSFKHILSTACSGIKYLGLDIDKHSFLKSSKLMCFIDFLHKSVSV